MTHKVFFILVLCLMALGLTASGMTAEPLGSGFTYQGELQDGEGPLNGSCDFIFSLWDKALNGSRLGQGQTLVDVAVADGRFTVLLNNAGQFGPDAFDGQARWLEISVRCPAKSGVYTKLQPRQQLTAAPYATYSQNGGGGDITAVHAGTGLSGGGENGDVTLSANSTYLQRRVDGSCAAGSSIRVINQDGTVSCEVDDGGGGGNDHNHLSQTWQTNNNHSPLRIEGPIPYFTGLLTLKNTSPDGYGLLIESGNDGVHVSSAGADGVEVRRAGNPSSIVVSDKKNGFEVAGTEGHGLFVGRADASGVVVKSAGGFGVYVESAGRDGLYVENADHDGLNVVSAGDDGVYVSSAIDDGVQVYLAGGNGVQVYYAGDDGVKVHEAGNPSTREYSGMRDGFEVAGAEGNGLFVGRADASGVVVNSAEVNGVRVEDAGWGGVSVGYAGTYGMHVHGSGSDAMYVHTAGQDGIHVSSATRYAGWFGGNVKVTGSCSGCLLVEYGVNSGETSLEAGDIVTIQGTVDSKFDGQPILLQVSAAQVEETAVGVVQGRANVEQYKYEGLEGSGETVERLVPGEGAAKPGEYVTIATFGPLRVKASQLGGQIRAGTRLAVDENGLARALQTTEVNGIQVAESAPVIGIALDEPDVDGLVWVLVNPQ